MTEEQILNNYTPIPYCGCWIWDGAMTDNGYGSVRYDGKTQRASRIFYKFLVGSIPEKMCVCHTCDNRLCVNPDHLFLGTQKDNIRDCVDKGRKAVGEKNGKSRLSEVDIRNIRKLLKDNIQQKDIAMLYNIGRSTVKAIKDGRTWGWLK